jgi:DNA-directed RNA polymerase subunit RPC12/RpoP
MATKRKSLSKKTRFEVFKRDGFKCQYCGAHPPSVLLEVDHVVAVAAGGGNDMDNLVTSCEPCNRGKGARDLSAVPETLEAKATAIREREEQLKGYHDAMEGKRTRLDKQAWELMNLWRIEKDSAPRDWMNSMRMFIDKLGYHEVRDSIEIAMAKSFYREEKTWRYFCGICWNKLRDQEMPDRMPWEKDGH